MTGYEEVLRREFQIPPHLDILCGVAVGWEDSSAAVARFDSGREDFENSVTFLRE